MNGAKRRIEDQRKTPVAAANYRAHSLRCSERSVAEIPPYIGTEKSRTSAKSNLLGCQASAKSSPEHWFAALLPGWDTCGKIRFARL